jgi:hypothetical protein
MTELPSVELPIVVVVYVPLSVALMVIVTFSIGS